MSYLFTCSHCQTKTLVDDRFSGQTGQCITCGADIRLPDFAPQSSRTTKASRTAGGLPIGSARPLVRRLAAATVCMVLVVCGVVAFMRYGGPAISNLQAKRQRSDAIRNIEKIAAALNAYAADHGVYPPPQIRTADGKPMHSWRVLILPYLDQQSLFNEYDLDQPWDSPRNYAIVDRMPAVYRGSRGSVFGTDTPYYLITGLGTLFPPAPPGNPTIGFRSLGPKDVIDNPGQTLLIVEAASPPNSMLVWTQPIDLDIGQMRGTIGGSPGLEIGGITEGGATVATIDGRGHFIDEATSPQTVMALVTIAGGEPLADDVLDR